MTIPPFTTITGNSFVSEFPDVQAFVDACARPTTRPASDCSSQDTGSRMNWYGSPDWQTAERLMTYGDPALEQQIVSMAQQIGEATGSQVQKMQYDYAIAGESVDIGQYLVGEPACMMYAEEVTRPGVRIIRMGYNAAAHCGTTARELQLKGAAFCVLVDALECAGYRCEIAVTQAVMALDHRSKGLMRIPIKSAQESLDMARLAYIIAHPSFLRRHLFRFEETMPESIIRCFHFSKSQAGYGYPADDDDFESGCDIYLPKNSTFYQPADAITWVKQQRDKFLAQPAR